jgi:hypothetical protein
MIDIYTLKPGDYVKCININANDDIKRRKDYNKLILNKVYKVLYIITEHNLIYIQYDDMSENSWSASRFVKAKQPILYEESL